MLFSGWGLPHPTVLRGHSWWASRGSQGVLGIQLGLQRARQEIFSSLAPPPKKNISAFSGQGKLLLLELDTPTFPGCWSPQLFLASPQVLVDTCVWTARGHHAEGLQPAVSAATSRFSLLWAPTGQPRTDRRTWPHVPALLSLGEMANLPGSFWRVPHSEPCVGHVIPRLSPSRVPIHWIGFGYAALVASGGIIGYAKAGAVFLDLGDHTHGAWGLVFGGFSCVTWGT